MVVQGKVVVVTGAGAGIGRDFAKAFAAHGAKVVVNDLARADDGAPAAERVAKEITELGGAAVASVESVAQWESAQRIVQAAPVLAREVLALVAAGNQVDNGHAATVRFPGERDLRRPDKDSSVGNEARPFSGARLVGIGGTISSTMV